MSKKPGGSVRKLRGIEADQTPAKAAGDPIRNDGWGRPLDTPGTTRRRNPLLHAGNLSTPPIWSFNPTGVRQATSGELTGAQAGTTPPAEPLPSIDVQI